ncbi:MAG: pseudouridine synthase [Bacteroidota bacterium]
MTYRDKLQYLLVRKLRIANKEAKQLIADGLITVNNTIVFDNVIVLVTDSVSYNNIIVQEPKQMLYIALYKPRGIEATLNETISDNLKALLPFDEKLFPVGRLDKESEGLLLMTNDGDLFNKITKPGSQIEKEYIVTVDKPIDENFVVRMSNGIEIMGQLTLPCKVKPIDDYTFRIILTQGLNRQIRRMCYKLNYEVLTLKRIRIDNVVLGDLKPGEYKKLNHL